MSVTLTLDLPPETLALAEEAAAARHTSLDRMLGLYLSTVAEGRKSARSTPLTDSLQGVMALPPDFEMKEFLQEEKCKKHGCS